jgi:acyl-CoA thioester hydrolase
MTHLREGRPQGGEAEHTADARPVRESHAADVAPSPTLPLSPSPTLPGEREGPYVAQSEVRVRYVETDQMGLAHHSNYFAWFEIGRTDFIRALGTSYARLERDGLLLAIAEASVRYLNGAHYDDVLVVRTRLERVQSRSVTFAYEVLRVEPEPQARIATAGMKLIALDRDGSPRTFPPDFRRLLDQVATPAADGA